MRIVVLLLAILGALGAGGAGALWFWNGFQELSTQETRFRAPNITPSDKAEARATLPMLLTEPYFLAAGCVLGLLAAFLASGYRGKSACVLLLLAGAGPLALAAPNFGWLTKKQDSLLALAAPCATLLLGGLLALLIRPKLALEGGEEDESAADEDEED